MSDHQGNTQGRTYQGNPLPVIYSESKSDATTGTMRHMSFMDQDERRPSLENQQSSSFETNKLDEPRSHLTDLLRKSYSEDSELLAQPDCNDVLAQPACIDSTISRMNYCAERPYFALWCAALVIMVAIFTSLDKINAPQKRTTYLSNNATTSTSCTSIANNTILLAAMGITEDEAGMAKVKHNSSISAKHGAVAADHPLCSRVGSDILQNQGGNAMDAAVATALCLGVTNPSSSGLGGGHFMLVHFGGQTEFLDARETAPGAATFDMYEHEDMPADASVTGGLAVAVWGEAAGLEAAHERYGKLPWNTVVQPAIDLAENGVEVSPYLAYALRYIDNKIEKFPKTFELFSKPVSKTNTVQEPSAERFPKSTPKRIFLEAGDLLVQPQLAATLRDIAENGTRVLYEGPRAQAMIDELQNEHGGIITMQDLKMYKPEWRKPLEMHSEQWGYTFVGAPPPSSGGGAIMGILRFLGGYVWSHMVVQQQSLTIHRLTEAMKHAFAIRMSLSDPHFPVYNGTTLSENRSPEAIHDLLFGDYMEMLRQNYTQDDKVMPISAYGGPKWSQLSGQDKSMHDSTSQGHDNPDRKLRHANGRNGIHDNQRGLRLYQYLNDHGTTSFSIVDSDRNAVAFSSTVNTEFGSGIWLESVGFILNNEMDDFSSPGSPNTFGLAPSIANYISPGKRPLSSMAPTMVFAPPTDGKGLGKLLMVLGSSGGPKIISAVVQVIINYMLLGKSLIDAVAHPRVHDQLLYHNEVKTLFDNFNLTPLVLKTSTETKNALMQRGHSLTPTNYTGTCQAIAVDLESNTLEAVSDPRKGGQPAGY